MKPIGAFDIASDIPDWASFGLLYADEADSRYREVVKLQRSRGFKVVLAVIGRTYTTPVDEAARSAKARCDQHGLVPDALLYGEEWYHPDKMALFPGEGIAQTRAVHAWVSAQHATLRSVFPASWIIFLEGFVCDVPIFGPSYYCPVPAHTSILAVEAYVPQAATWDAALMDAKLAYACGQPYTYFDPETKRVVTAQRTEPVILVTQAFRTPGDPSWGSWVTDETIARTAPWLAHPRVIGQWPFVERSRPGINSWFDWPERWKLGAAWGLPV